MATRWEWSDAVIDGIVQQLAVAMVVYGSIWQLQSMATVSSGNYRLVVVVVINNIGNFIFLLLQKHYLPVGMEMKIDHFLLSRMQLTKNFFFFLKTIY